MTDQRIDTFKRDGLVFDVVDQGPIDGPVVVMLHGFPSRASQWSTVTTVLNAAGLRTIAPDQRGYSPRARPRPIHAYRLRELTSDACALIDAVGGRAHLVGHDWGAAVAWNVAASYPDSVASLTAVSVGHPMAFAQAMITSTQALKWSYAGLFALPKLPEHLLTRDNRWARYFMRQSGMTDSMADAVRTDIIEYGALTGALNWYRALPLSFTKPVPKVDVPTTLVWSASDPFVGRKQAELSASYVKGPYECVELTGCGHWIPEQGSAELASAIRRRVGSVTV